MTNQQTPEVEWKWDEASALARSIIGVFEPREDNPRVTEQQIIDSAIEAFGLNEADASLAIATGSLWSYVREQRIADISRAAMELARLGGDSEGLTSLASGVDNSLASEKYHTARSYLRNLSTFAVGYLVHEEAPITDDQVMIEA